MSWHRVADRLTPAQRRMVLDSEPDDITGDDGCGVELRTGAHYATARALVRLDLGRHSGPGGSLPGMYFNNVDGLYVRSLLLGEPIGGEDVDDGVCPMCGTLP